MKTFTGIAIGVFSVVAVLHLLRIIFGWEVTLNGTVIPLYANAIGFVIAGGLAVGLWRENRK